MSESNQSGLEPTLEKLRTYLAFQVRRIVDPRLKNQLDLSGVVSQTWVEAWQTLNRIKDWNDAQKAAWLDQILGRNLKDEIDKLHAGCRDVRRQRSLDEALQQSSARLGNVLALEQSSPSQRAECNEQELQLAAAIERLPEDQREALVLQLVAGPDRRASGPQCRRRGRPVASGPEAAPSRTGGAAVGKSIFARTGPASLPLRIKELLEREKAS